MDDKPIWSAPSPNFGDIHHARQDAPHPSGHVCKFTTFETFLNLDRLTLPAWMFTAATCIRTCQNGYIQKLLDSSRSFYSAKKELRAACPPQPLHALRPSQVTTLITHALTYPRLGFSIARLPV
jgi:hypothetical protein